MTDKVGEIQHALRGLSAGPGRVVLIAEPSPDQQARLARLLAVRGHRAIGTTSLDGALAFMRAFPVDLVLLAEELAGDTPVTAVAEFLAYRPSARVVIMTPATTAECDREATSPRPPLEYLRRPFDGDVLTALLLG